MTAFFNESKFTFFFVCTILKNDRLKDYTSKKKKNTPQIGLYYVESKDKANEKQTDKLNGTQ